MSDTNQQTDKSAAALREEAVLTFWQQNDIFKKSLEKPASKGDFIFYEGPPTANAKPALHHLEARAFKDVIPRYKTMQGFRVPRRAGWDTHGLPVELQIEKKLGLQSKKDIETYGIAAFNKECKESVFEYIGEWEKFTDRIGYWVDKEKAYYTFDAPYMESIWNIVSHVDKQGLLYKDYRISPWCARCGTTLATHELAQGYQDDKDLSVYAKFKLEHDSVKVLRGRIRSLNHADDGLAEDVYIVAWTTTPWTLPGNTALAVGGDIQYSLVRHSDQQLIIATERLGLLEGGYEVLDAMRGSDLVGFRYQPIYPYLRNSIPSDQNEKLWNAFAVYAADFVTTTDGTGIVHIAPMYGADDFALGTKVGLPKFHTVTDEGKFIAGTDFLEGRFVKDEDVAVDIIKDLAHRGLLFKKEKYEHSYPHCWRCKTPLIYFARDSWYIGMEQLRDKLVAANEHINWEPEHIKEGRFGEWLRGIKDWAVSRERYWGTPLPIWQSPSGKRIVVDSVNTLKEYGTPAQNTYYVMRHGQTENNVKHIWNLDVARPDPLTALGVEGAKATAASLKDKGIDLIVVSPFARTQETARIVAETLGLSSEQIVTDERLAEWRVGAMHDGRELNEFFGDRNSSEDRYGYKTEDGESYKEVLVRSGQVLYGLEETYAGKNILIISHGAPTRALELIARGYTLRTLFADTREYKNFDNAEVRALNFVPLPHNDQYELDLHRPYIDQVTLTKDGEVYTRIKEVMDVWFDSGAMPFAQDHYMGEGALSFPADFISEAIDQTRGWFYTLHAIGTLMGKGAAYKNVICLGHLLDASGKKMSKSIGNIVEPFSQIEKFGVDTVRLWMYSVNQPGDSKNYDEKTVMELHRQVFGLLYNVLSFYELYRVTSIEKSEARPHDADIHVLDAWIMARLDQLTQLMTESLDAYKLFEPVRAFRDFIDDLSTWYVRRSRDRIKDGDVGAKATLYRVLKQVAQLIAPFAPFAAEDIWQKLKTETDVESVHLSEWPTAMKSHDELLSNMNVVREICTAGNALRKKLAIPVRQPLAKLIAKDWNLGAEYAAIIMDELNVKEVVVGDETSLDTEITPALKLEGDYRELVRSIQDMRKDKGLAPSDTIMLTLPNSASKILEKFGDELKKTVGAKEVVVSGEEIILG